jgi:ribA/ribD-fused uncharacterized protein
VIEIAFTKVRLPFGWLGNMSPHPINIEGVIWPTAEHLFQALRFGRNAVIREDIRLQKSPMQAKFVAKRYVDQMTTVPRSEDDVLAMKMVLLLKLHEHPALKEQLLATGDTFIVEDESARAHRSPLFWGAKRIPGGWQGDNRLGKLWMEIRQSLRDAA